MDNPGAFDSPAAALAWSTAGFLREGRLPEALEACEQALAVQERAGLRRGIASVRTTLGAILTGLGRFDEARDVLELALRAHEAHGDERLLALTRQELATALLEVGEVDLAFGLLVAAARAHARAGDTAFELRALLRLGLAHHAAGRMPEAQLQLELARARANELKNGAVECLALADLAALEHERGHLNSASRLYAEALELTGHTPPAAEVATRLGLARVHLERQQREQAEREAREALALASATLAPFGEGAAEVVLAACDLAAGRTLEAEARLDRAAGLLAPHPLLIELVGLGRGGVDLVRADRDAAFGRLGAVPLEALSSVPVRLSLRLLRHALARSG